MTNDERLWVLARPTRLGLTTVPSYDTPQHVLAFEQHFLRLVTDPAYNRLVVDVACRHGKSFQFSQLFPAWHLLALPGNVIICAHTADLASEFVSWIRALLLRIAPSFGLQVDPDQRSTSHVRILGAQAPKELYAIGRGGAVAGRGASLICVDDVLKDQTEAASPTIRNGINAWFHAELLTRANPGAKIVICMSRRHPDDLSGFCLKQNVLLEPIDHWHHVRYPAISDAGVALWPERYSIDKLRRIQREYAQTGHGYLFDSLFLQIPTADPTAIEFPRAYFSDIWYTDPPASPAYAFGGLDPAQGKSDTGDYSCAIYAILGHDGCLYVDDVLMLRTPITDFEQRAAAFYASHEHDAILVEDNIESGFAYHMTQAAAQLGAQIYANTVHNTQNKVERIRKYLTPWLHAHKLKFRDTPMMRAAVQHIMDFPSGAFDDFADAVSMTIQMHDTFTGTTHATALV